MVCRLLEEPRGACDYSQIDCCDGPCDRDCVRPTHPAIKFMLLHAWRHAAFFVSLAPMYSTTIICVRLRSAACCGIMILALCVRAQQQYVHYCLCVRSVCVRSVVSCAVWHWSCVHVRTQQPGQNTPACSKLPYRLQRKAAKRSPKHFPKS